jgi:predicted RNA-binding protein with PIN domain
MLIIVDGYNYIGHSRELELSDPTARDKIVYLMGQYCRRVHKSVTIVFDGNYFVDLADRKRRYGRVTVVYTSPIYTADDMIKKMVRRQEPKQRKSLLVVSSDDEILQYTKSHGASAVRSEDFEYTISQVLASDPEIERVNVHVSPQEVQEWLKIFEEAHSKHERSEKLKKDQDSVAKPKTGKLNAAQASTTEEHPEKIADYLHKKRGQTSKNRPRAKLKGRKQRKSLTSQTDECIDRINIHLSPEEVREWMDIFGTNGED